MKTPLKALFVLFILSLSLLSCKKEDKIPKYTLRFTNTSSNPYKVEAGGNTDIVSGNSYIEYELEKNTYSWKVTQQSGYLLYPTVREGTVTLDQDKEIVFP